MGRFDGKVALVTGAASGIGAATAERLASEGASVFAVDRDADGLATTAATAGDAVTTRVADLLSVATCEEVVAAAVEEFGKLDVLCNIAGIAKASHSTDFTEEQWDMMLGVNTKAVFFLSKAAIPHLLESRGNIVNLASNAGLVGLGYNAAYCASKHAVVGITRSMAVEYGRRGVRVNAICPGGVNTPLTKNFEFPSDNHPIDPDVLGRLQFLEQMAEPGEIAALLAHVASDDGVSILGSAISIDGGQHIA